MAVAEGKAQISATITEDMVTDILAIASNEPNRSFSSMVCVLLAEAIKNRKENGKPY